MDQITETTPIETQQDVSKCLVHSLGAGLEVCMVNAHCVYAVPYGNFCTHPLVGQISNLAL